MISVSEVGVSNDLHTATVFVSSIGDEQAQHKAFAPFARPPVKSRVRLAKRSFSATRHG